MRLPSYRQYPKTVTICGAEWTIQFRRKPIDPEPDPPDPEWRPTLGICDPSNKTISIMLGLDKTELFRTYVHEVLHAFEDESDFEIDHPIVDRLELWITDFFISNFLDLPQKQVKSS